MKKNVVIVAGGENTRFKEMSIFPKVLLPTLTHSSILEYDCELFKDWNVWLVINNKYKMMLKQYIEKTKLDVNLIVSYDHNGSANTLKSVIDLLPRNNVLFVWSDLILDEDGVKGIEKSVESINSKNIIFSYKGKYRYNCDKFGNLRNDPKYNGNVPGIYWSSDILKTLNEGHYPDGFDYVQIFERKDHECCCLEYVGKIIEFRDLETYLKYYDKNNDVKHTKTRFFNKLKHDKDIVVKQCSNPDFNYLIDKEILWYQKCKDNGYSDIPKIYDMSPEYHFIKMEWLDGYENIYKAIKNGNHEEFENIMKIWISSTKKLHDVDRCDIIKNVRTFDFNKEFYDKVISRCNRISGILYDYDESILVGFLNQANEIIDKYFDDDICKYCFIHGDMNGSNVMWNPKTNTIKLIDPRGYFGNSVLKGPALYDYAKIMYCLSGYDDFNNGRYIFTKSWYDTPKSIGVYDFGKYQDLLEICVAIIWICLGEYISQDVFKANIAYHYGLDLLKSSIRRYYYHNKKTKIVISDCDGILTNGNSIYTSDGKVAKIYGAYDSEAIAYANDNGWEIKFVSDDKSGADITKKRVSQYENKSQATFEIATPQERKRMVENYVKQGYYVVFVGDSVSDIDAGMSSNYFCTTNNAFDIVKKKANFISKRDGGNGGFAEILYHICNKDN